MADDFEVRGADDFIKLSKALKAAGQKELRKNLHKRMRQAAKPLVGKAKGAALDELPQGGGLAKRVATQSGLRAEVRTGEATAGVRITAKKSGAARTLNDSGTVRHPVYGTDNWVVQSVPGAIGWFERAMRKHAPEVRTDLEHAIQDTIDEIVRDAT